MILVIFGAGASFDSVPHKPPDRFPRAVSPNRLPLANELFLDNGLFARELSRYPQCNPIVPYLRPVPDGETIESALERLQTEAEADTVRKVQLTAVRFYLHNVIWESERKWTGEVGGVTNYVTLIDQLRRGRQTDEPVCLVTFNYDRMIETALASVGITFDNLGKYITSDSFKLYKLHGSVNWARELSTPIPNIEGMSNDWQVGDEIIRMGGGLEISDRYRVVGERPIGRAGNLGLYPALAIPVETKRDFECPADHLESLRTYLPRITKILVIGWRATEGHFLRLLGELLADPVGLCVVDYGPGPTEQVVERIRQIPIRVAKPVTHIHGFSDFVSRRYVEAFLRS